MKISFVTKTLIIIFTAISFCFDSLGQNCSSISEKKDKQKGIVIFGGVTTSKDFYSLLIQKEKELNTGVTPIYSLYLNAASRVLLSDSILNTSGTVEVQLFNGKKVIYPDISYYNNPLGSCCSLGFKVYLTENQVKEISINPIVSLSVLGILTTSFSNKKQKEQQKIINCLLTKN